MQDIHILRILLPFPAPGAGGFEAQIATRCDRYQYTSIAKLHSPVRAHYTTGAPSAIFRTQHGYYTYRICEISKSVA